MENEEIALIFSQIADLLEIKGDNPFRIRSYRFASEVIEGLPINLSTIATRDEPSIEAIPGIGKAIHEKIMEILRTGSCALFQELLDELSPGLLEELKVSGLGPKKVKLFYDSLGIKSVEELERVARDGLLRELPGMGEKSELKILKAIAGYKRLRGGPRRYRLSVALAYAEQYMGYLRECEDVSTVQVGGSIRRALETIGDVDILVTIAEGKGKGKSKDASAKVVMDHFVSYPDVGEVVSRGSSKSTVILKKGLQVDLELVPQESLGAALQYFTGSKVHNIALRERAKRLGFRLSEYGLFNEKTGKRVGRPVAGATEAEVYQALGLEWMPPEIREGSGELEAAEDGSLPKLVELSDIRGDLHMHTTASDGAATIEEMAGAAMELGYEYIAVTDHSRAVGIAHGLDEERLLRHTLEIDAFNESLARKGISFTVLKGAEVDIMADGTLDYSAQALKSLDCVVGAVHSGFDMDCERMTARVIKAMSTGHINILAHPTGRLIGIREPYAIDIERVVSAASVYNVFLELNSYPERLDLSDLHCRLALESGVLVAVSTDAHSTKNLKNIRYGLSTARRGWLEKKDVLNTYPVGELKELLGRGP